MTSPDNRTKPKVGAGRPADVLTNLPAAITGRASPAKAAVGDKPVFACISSLPQPQRSIAKRVDALAAETLPGLQRSVKWGMAWYGGRRRLVLLVRRLLVWGLLMLVGGVALVRRSVQAGSSRLRSKLR